MARITTKDIMEKCNVKVQTIYNWIKEGQLHGIQVGNGKLKKWEFEEEEFNRFLREGNYPGKADYIKTSESFTRTPNVEECYPVNLLTAVMNINSDRDPMDEIWNYDIRAFKEVINSKLTDREQKVISMRYQFGASLYEAGKAFDVTKERIRQIEAKALRKLAHYSRENERCILISRDKYDELNSKYTKLLVSYERELAKNHENTNILDTIDICELDLSVRPYNCLKRASINTLQDIMEFDKNQETKRNWLTIRNLGRRSLYEIAYKVFDYCGYNIHHLNGEEIKEGDSYYGQQAYQRAVYHLAEKRSGGQEQP